MMKLFTFDSHLYLVIPLLMFVAYFVVLACSRIFSEKFFISLKKSVSYVSVSLVAFGAGIGVFSLVKLEYKVDFVPLESTPYEITGVMDGNVLSNSKAEYFFLNNVYVFEDNQEVHLKRNLRVYVSKELASQLDLEQIKSGDQVFFKAYLDMTPVFKTNGIDSFAYKNNFQHTAYLYSTNVAFVEGKMDIFDFTKNAVHDLYQKNFDPLYAGFALSVISGDKTELDSEMYSNFSRVGIAHIVAISGLHVGFLVVMLLWMLKRSRFNRWVKLSIVVGVLSVYAIFCGASPSVVRASIMAVILLIGNLFGKQTDSLNSVSLAGVLILLFAPLFLFDLGFLLSFAGVFGIFFLYPVLKNALKFLHYKWIIKSLAITLSADIATLPIIANHFGFISVVSCISNLVLVPLFGFIFMLLFVLTIICLILPFLGFLLRICQWGLLIIERGAAYLASLPFASFDYSGFRTGALISYYTGMFCASRYLIISPKSKIALVSLCYGIFTCFVLFALI